MSIQVITASEINRNKVASLPSRPNASTAFGGVGYTSAQLRAAFDRLPLLLAQRYNALVEAIAQTGNSSLAAAVPTGISDNEGNVYSLAQLFSHLTDGTLASYMKVDTDAGGAGTEKQSLDTLLAAKAPLASPVFTGTPTATTAAVSDDSARVATTAFVHDVLETVVTVIGQIQAGYYGNVPTGGAQGAVLTKASAADHAVEWASLADYAFGSPTATTPTLGDNTTKLATTAFVKAAIDALKNGVDTAYDTLQEIAEALTENTGDIAGALATIAEKDNKTVFATFESGDTVTLQSHREYRATQAVSALTLTLPVSPDADFICAVDFTAHPTTDMNYSYTSIPSVYTSGDDCTDGVFIPCKGYHYTWVLWYAAGKYQGVARRSE